MLSCERFNKTKGKSVNLEKTLDFKIKQAEAEVVPSSSLVEVRVEFAVCDEFEVGVEVGAGVELRFRCC